MALRAVRREARRHVIGIRRALEIRHVTADASRAGQIVVVVDVTVSASARRHGVQAGQREIRHRIVIELRVQPVIGAVAGIAGDGKLGGYVVGIGGSVVVGLMAGVALDRHRLKLAVGGILVAGVAIHRGVSSGEREAVVVILDLLYRNVPSPHRVALLAVGSQLPPVNIGVAILAACADIVEDHLDVTLGAGYRRVHAAKGIAGLIVIEFWDGADRLPSTSGVAILTRNGQIAVRAMRARRLRRHACRSSGQRQ